MSNIPPESGDGTAASATESAAGPALPTAQQQPLPSSNIDAIPADVSNTNSDLSSQTAPSTTEESFHQNDSNADIYDPLPLLESDATSLPFIARDTFPSETRLATIPSDCSSSSLNPRSGNVQISIDIEPPPPNNEPIGTTVSTIRRIDLMPNASQESKNPEGKDPQQSILDIPPSDPPSALDADRTPRPGSTPATVIPPFPISFPSSDAHATPLPPIAPCIDPVTEDEFEDIVESVRVAIQEDAQPMRIGQGSSGSYFCRNTEGQIVGVFKPKDEEPYGEFNPKWTKWIHKNFFFCCFGRSCLIPNVGYLSEAGASLLDERLGFGIVPKTRVVSFASPAFYYHRRQLRKNPADLPPKLGSFQLFLRGFKDASIFLKIHPLPQTPPALPLPVLGISPGADSETRVDIPMSPVPPSNGREDSAAPLHDATSRDGMYEGIWTPEVYASFLEQFQRLACLDFIMRNTDRGADNWMIRYHEGRIQIAAIDHGLAFPFKHPDKWRSYPYGWLYLPIAKVPFLPSIRTYLLGLLRDPLWWQRTRTDLRALFCVDSDFDPHAFECQMSVVRGQLFVLLKILERQNGSPWDLWFETPILVVRQHPSTTSRPAASTSTTPSSPRLRAYSYTAVAAASGEASGDFAVAGVFIDEHHVWDYDQNSSLSHSDGSESSEDLLEEDPGGRSAQKPLTAPGNSSERPRRASKRANGIASSSSGSAPPNHTGPSSSGGRGRYYKVAPHDNVGDHNGDDLEGDPSIMRDRVRSMWTRGARKVRAGGQRLVQRARNVVLEVKRRPWFHNW